MLDFIKMNRFLKILSNLKWFSFSEEILNFESLEINSPSVSILWKPAIEAVLLIVTMEFFNNSIF